jgi:hypothetical protein
MPWALLLLRLLPTRTQQPNPPPTILAADSHAHQCSQLCVDNSPFHHSNAITAPTVSMAPTTERLTLLREEISRQFVTLAASPEEQQQLFQKRSSPLYRSAQWLAEEDATFYNNNYWVGLLPAFLPNTMIFRKRTFSIWSNSDNVTPSPSFILPLLLV